MVFFAQTMTGFRVVVKGRWNGIGKHLFSDRTFESACRDQVGLRKGGIRLLTDLAWRDTLESRGAIASTLIGKDTTIGY